MAKRMSMKGQRFGDLVVVSPFRKDGQKRPHWLCECDCGNKVVYPTNKLKDGRRKSCGCRAKKDMDIEGKRFGRLVTIERVESAKGGHARWRCECDCGNETIVHANSLKRGFTKSCGCLKNGD